MTAPLAQRAPLVLHPDPARVIVKLFVPGHDTDTGTGHQVDTILEHVSALAEDEVQAALASLTDRFADRHRDLVGAWRRSADRVISRMAPSDDLSDDRRLLLGATFTHEFSVGAAALCNPSAVVAPDQSGVPVGAVRFVMSVREIGEGHRSSIGFRTGVLTESGTVEMDEPSTFATAGQATPGRLAAGDLGPAEDPRGDDDGVIAWALDRLGAHFSVDELEEQLLRLESQSDVRRHVSAVVQRVRASVARSYAVAFPAESEIGERVLHPTIAAEVNGMEDARFVRFVDADGSVRYMATYTAYDGHAIAQQLLTTADFERFQIAALHGDAAANKGLALFPRRVGGRYVAVTRHDGVTLSIATSVDQRHWPTATPLDVGVEGWSVIQLGNCGAPIETDRGWLVLTHGVGPMRTYSLGAVLLDLDDPTQVIGQLSEPLLSPRPDEQDGYVPNVVYSCGAMRHGQVLLIPLGIADARIGFATVDLDELLDAMGEASPQRRTTTVVPMGAQA